MLGTLLVLLLQAEVLELKANPGKALCQGVMHLMSESLTFIKHRNEPPPLDVVMQSLCG